MAYQPCNLHVVQLLAASPAAVPTRITIRAFIRDLARMHDMHSRLDARADRALAGDGGRSRGNSGGTGSDGGVVPCRRGGGGGGGAAAPGATSINGGGGRGGGKGRDHNRYGNYR